MPTSTRKPSAISVPSKRRGRPRGSKNRGSQWFNAAAARLRLSQLDRELEQLRMERALLVQVLGQGRAVSPAHALLAAGAAPHRTGRAGRRTRDGRPSVLDLLERIISQGPPNKGWTVGELRDQLKTIEPSRANAVNASALISSALVQALRAKKARFIGSKGGRGHAREYRLAKPTA